MGGASLYGGATMYQSVTSAMYLMLSLAVIRMGRDVRGSIDVLRADVADELNTLRAGLTD